MSRALPLALLGLSLTGCKKLDAAPQELDGLLHWFWRNYEDASDEELAEGAVNLYDAVDADSWEELSEGTVSRLTRDEAAAVGVTDRDPADAPGIFLVNVYQCTLGKLEPILLYKDQDVLYDGVYDRYDREYTSSRADYESRASPTMTWDVEYEATILGSSYTANIEGGLRRVPKLDDEQSPHGPLVLARTHLPRPAVFEGDGDKSQEQDYQLEIYLSRGDGTLLHVYGMWRQANFGAGFTSEDKGVQTILLNSLADWDTDTEAHCLAGRP